MSAKSEQNVLFPTLKRFPYARVTVNYSTFNLTIE